MAEEEVAYPYEYRGFKYGLTVCMGSVAFYSEKIVKQGKPQMVLRASTREQAHRELKRMIDKKLK